MKTSGKINGKELNRLVTLYSDQNLTGTYIFLGKTTVDSNLDVSGLVNGINVLDWQQRTVTLYSNDTQLITNPVVVHGSVEFQKGFSGSGYIGGLNLSQVMDIAYEKSLIKFNTEIAMKVNYCFFALKERN